MAKLYCADQNEKKLLLENLEVADSFFERGRGLLGRQALSSQQGLWIKPCTDVHTFFMKFNIDCIFVDRKMNVTRIVHNLKPFRIALSLWKSHSVIEAQAGFAKLNNINIGDQLYVVS